jgi:hypothetical protein
VHVAQLIYLFSTFIIIDENEIEILFFPHFTFLTSTGESFFFFICDSMRQVTYVGESEKWLNYGKAHSADKNDAVRRNI